LITMSRSREVALAVNTKEESSIAKVVR